MTWLPEERERLASELARGPVTCLDRIALPRGTLEVWTDAGCAPPPIVPLFVGVEDSEVFPVDQAWVYFERMLRVAQVPLHELQLVATLIDYAPGLRRVALDERLVPAAHRADRWRPEFTEGHGWTACCNDFQDGLWERIHITPTYKVEITVLGKGLRLRRK